MPSFTPVDYDPFKPAVASDVAKSIGSNVVGGGIDLAMVLPNLINSAVAGPQLLGRGIAEGADSLLGIEPQPRGEVWQPFFGSSDVEKKIGTDYQPETTAGKLTAFPARVAGSIGGATTIQKLEPGVAGLLKNESGVKPQPQQTTSADIKRMANDAYGLADQNGGILKPHVINKFIDDIQGLAPQTQEGKMLAGDSAFTKNVEILQQLKDRPLTLKAAQEIDEILGEKIDNFVDRTTGAMSKEGKKLLDVQTTFRKAIDDAAERDMVGGQAAGFDAWKQGKQLWSSSAKLRDIERIISRAEMTDNPATAIKTGFRNLYNNPARMRGFDDDEAALIKKAAESGIISDTLRTFGSRIIPGISLATGGGLSGAAASQAATMASRGAASKVQIGKAQKAADLIANNAIAKTPQEILPPISKEGVSIAPLLGESQAAKDIKAIPRQAAEAPKKFTPVDYDPFAPQDPSQVGPQSSADPIVQNIATTESSNRDFDNNGNIIKGPMTKYGQAEGAMQVLPMTQRDPGFGVAPAKDKSPEELRRVGEDYFEAMKKKYNQNMALALMAYNWGPGNTDEWLAKGANPEKVPDETRKYLAKILRSS